jgi:membrane protease YdiL (CAAX protease family)
MALCLASFLVLILVLLLTGHSHSDAHRYVFLCCISLFLALLTACFIWLLVQLWNEKKAGQLGTLILGVLIVLLGADSLWDGLHPGHYADDYFGILYGPIIILMGLCCIVGAYASQWLALHNTDNRPDVP